VYFTRHAKNKMRDERLTPADVEFIVRNPLRTEPETKGNWRYLGQIEGRWFRVVIAGDDPDVVISVHPRRRP
jgi:hypothetical protein